MYIYKANVIGTEELDNVYGRFISGETGDDIKTALETLIADAKTARGWTTVAFSLTEYSPEPEPFFQ